MMYAKTLSEKVVLRLESRGAFVYNNYELISSIS